MYRIEVKNHQINVIRTVKNINVYANAKRGLPGADGQPGEKGDKGDKGDTGVGIPTGGAAGQVLSKATNDDYDTEWADVATIPEGNDLNAFMASFSATITQSQLYRDPTPTEIAQFIDGMSKVMAGRTDHNLGSLGFTVTRGFESVTKRPYALIVNEYGTERAWGAYLIDMSKQVDSLIEIPHPVADGQTQYIGLDMWRGNPGSMLMLAGAHRLAAGGQADVCDFTTNMFYAVGVYFTEFGVSQVQPHGFANSSAPNFDVIVSSGASNATTLGYRIAEALESNGFRVGRSWDGSATVLLGLTNTLGVAARASGDVFVHIEINNTIRTSPALRQHFADIMSTVGYHEAHVSNAPLLAEARTGQFPIAVGSVNVTGSSPYAARSDHTHRLTTNTPENGQYLKRSGGQWVSVPTSELISDIGFTPSNYVTLNTSQTITGSKTFTSAQTFGTSDDSFLNAFQLMRNGVTIGSIDNNNSHINIRSRNNRNLRLGNTSNATIVEITNAGGVTIAGETSLSNNKITNVATPTANQDAANKLYVDNGLSAKANTADLGAAAFSNSYSDLDDLPDLYDSSDFDSDFSEKTTTDLPEGDNLYFTDQRAIDAVSGEGYITEVNWGDITGTLTDQTDLQSALDAKYDASNPAGYITASDIPAAPVTSVNTKTGDVVLSGEDVRIVSASPATVAQGIAALITNKAEDSQVIHTTGNETKNGDLTVNGQFNVLNGTLTAGTTADVFSTVVSIIRNNVQTGRLDNNGNGLRVQATSGQLQLRGSSDTGINIASDGAATFTGSVLNFNNGLRESIISRTSGATLATNTPLNNLCNATSGAFTLTLPSAAVGSGQTYLIKKIDSSSNAVTIAAASGQTIDGMSTYPLNTQWKYVRIVSNGTNAWSITGNN